MDPDPMRTVPVLIVLVLLSAYFSATETAFSSLNRIRIKALAEAGNARAALTLRLAEDYDRLLSTILVGNNLVNILLTALATVLFVSLYGQGTGATVATVVSTVVVLIFGEISPKSLAKDHAEGFAMATAPLLRGIVVLLTPVNWIFSLWKRLLSAVFHAKADPAVTEQELLTIVDEAREDGALNEQEGELIHRVIDFNDRTAVDILIPRVDVVAVPADADAESLRGVFADTGYSRLPVYEDTIDRIVGVIHWKDLALAPDPASLRERMKPPVFVPPTMKIRLLLRRLQAEKAHLAIVSDEYGGTLGIVTMEDILEELVGEIWDEHDDIVEPIRPTADGGFAVLASTELKAVMELCHTATACDAATVGGWVMESLGRIPVAGDTFTADGLAVTVTRVDGNRPEEIRIHPLPPEE